MGLDKLAAKIDAYNARLEEGKARRILPRHVLRVLEKLRAKEHDLLSAIEGCTSSEARLRLERKFEVLREQITRAEYLLDRFR